MSTRPLPKSALPDPSYHWTTHKAAVFLSKLAEHGRIGEAAAAVGMSRQSAYKLRARLGGGGVSAQAWDRAQAAGRAKRQALRKATPLPSDSDIFGLGR